MSLQKCYVLLVTLVLSNIGFAQVGIDFYADRTITILVGSGAGGTTDLTGRLIAQHIKKFIPGNPSIIVQNMPGGGSITMTNHIARSAPRNGTVLGYSLPGIITAQLMEPERAKYDGRELNWIGSALKYTGIISVLHTAPVTTLEGTKHTELFIGSTGRGSPAHQFPAMAQALLGLKFNMITGYESSNDVVLAMERGEVHGQSSSLQYWAISRPNWLTDGRIAHLLYVGPPDSLALPNVPYLHDLVSTEREKALTEFIEIGSNLGWPLFAPPDVPVDRIKDLRVAFSALVVDPDFLDAIENTIRAKVNPSIGNELAEFVNQALNTPDSVLSEAKNILGLDQ